MQIVGPGWDRGKLHHFLHSLSMGEVNGEMSSTESASLASGVGTSEEVKCIAWEQNVPFAFGCDSGVIRLIYCDLLLNFCAPTVYVKLESSPVVIYKGSEA